MHALKKTMVLVLSLLALIASDIFAQNAGDALRLSEPGLASNARALGMGNAYTALSDDFSASSFNPAGFALIKRMEFAGGMFYSKFNNSTSLSGSGADYSGGVKTNYSNSTTKLDNLSFAFPFPTLRGSLVFAIGYNKDKDFNGAVNFNGYNSGNTSMIQSLLGPRDLPYYLYLTDSTGDNTPINGKLNQDGTTLSKGSIGKWAFSGASEVAPNVFVGATLNVYSGDYSRTRDYYEEDTKNVYRNIQTDPGDITTRGFRLFYFNDILNWDISGWDANIGFLYQMNKYREYGLRIGGNIKFPAHYIIKENYTVTGRSEFADGQVISLNNPFESSSEYDILTPYIFSCGAAFNYKGAVVSAGISYIDYTGMEFTGGLSSMLMALNNKDIKEQFRGVVNYNLGAEYTIPEIDLRVRAGFMMNPSPYISDQNVSDYDKKYITGGLGFLADESFAFDIAYAYGWWKDIGDNYGVNVSRTNQDIKSRNMIFTVTYRF
ncbi:MAG: outer membrane protein transport protein [Ignavibacteria bacterium]